MTARRATGIGFAEIVSSEPTAWEIQTTGPGPQGSLPLTDEMLRERPERRPVRADAERRHGLEPGASWAGPSS